MNHNDWMTNNNLKTVIREVLIKIDKTATFTYPLNHNRETFSEDIFNIISHRSFNYGNYIYEEKGNNNIVLGQIIYSLVIFLSRHLLINGNKRLLVALMVDFLKYYLNLYPIQSFYDPNVINELIIKSQNDKDHFSVLKSFISQYFSNVRLSNHDILLNELIEKLALM